MSTEKIGKNQIQTTIGNSWDILRYLYGMNVNNGDVGKFLEPTEEAVRLEEMFDKLAIANRR